MDKEKKGYVQSRFNLVECRIYLYITFVWIKLSSAY